MSGLRRTQAGAAIPVTIVQKRTEAGAVVPVEVQGDVVFTPDMLAAILAGAPGGPTVSDEVLKLWTESGGFHMVDVTYHGTYTKAVATATGVWPDGSAGTFTTDAYNTTASPARVNAFHVTHTASGKTITQAACTLNGDGEITHQPELTIA